jgi:hypothetical protein
MRRVVDGMVDEMARLITKVEKEDKLIERQAVLMPTKNYLLVENLRNERNRLSLEKNSIEALLEKERQEKEKERQEKEAALARAEKYKELLKKHNIPLDDE